jgi:hypothetical protein
MADGFTSRDAKRCQDSVEELRATSVIMSSDDCYRVREELAAEYETMASGDPRSHCLAPFVGSQEARP